MKNISYVDTHSSSHVNIQLFDNIDNITRGIGFDFSIVIASFFIAITSVTVSLLVNWKLTLISLCVLPILIGGLYLFSKLTINETKNELNTYSKAGKIVEEVFSSLRTVLSLNGQEFEKKRYERELHATQWSSVRKGATLGLFVGWLFFIYYIIYFVVFVAGSRLISHEGCNQLNISSIIIIVLILTESITFMSYLSPCFQSLADARGTAAQVFALIDEAETANVNETELLKEDISEKGSTDINGDIEFVNVNFTYPTRTDAAALTNLNLVARAGETTALVGHSGSGKSTCISLLLRYYEPSSGKIMINGQSITEHYVKQLRKNIGVVSQEPILFNTSIYENIRYGKEDATKDEIEEAARQANAHNFIMQLPNKYETIVGQHGAQLSGGEKQRVAIARVLVKQPSILLLDEATSALDNNSERIVQEALDRASQNRTTIVIAHRLTTIQNADSIYVFDNGNVIEQGTHETLMAKEDGKYKQMVSVQQMEPTDDDVDETIIQSEIQSEDERKRSDLSRLLSDGQHDHVENEKASSSNQQSIFLRLLHMNSPEWISILLGCTMSTAAGTFEIVVFILLPQIISALANCTYGQQSHQVIVLSCLLLLMGIIILFVRFFQFIAFAVSGSNLTQRIRAKAFASLLRQEVAFFDQSENNSSSINTRLSSDARAVQQMTGPRLGMIWETTTMLGLGLVLGFFFNYQLTLIVIIYLTFIIFISYLDIRIKSRVSKHSQFCLEQASELTGESLHNMRTVKNLTAEKKLLRQYSELIDQSFIIDRTPSILSALAFAIFFSTYAYILAALYWRGLVLVEHNELNPSNMVMVYAFADFLMSFLQVLSYTIEDMSTSISGVQYFFDLFDRTPIIDNSSTEGEELINFRGDIEFDQVKFTYASRSASQPILNNFRLSIKRGQRVALVGASGSGKSTAIQLLERYYDVTHGQIRFDGVDIRELNIHWIRSSLGLVSQEPILFDMTIAENIAYAKDNVPLEDIIDAATKANIHQFIQQLPQGYETRVGLKGSQLSGGEKQRIAIARALLRRPKVLLLDEATSAMDPHNEQIIQEALEQIHTEDSSQTMLIVAHRLSTIRSCDLICVVQNGRIIESGTHMDLMQHHGPYYTMLTQHTS